MHNYMYTYIPNIFNIIIYYTPTYLPIARAGVLVLALFPVVQSVGEQLTVTDSNATKYDTVGLCN